MKNLILQSMLQKGHFALSLWPTFRWFVSDDCVGYKEEHFGHGNQSRLTSAMKMKLIYSHQLKPLIVITLG
jgi:hypothetical protein